VLTTVQNEILHVDRPTGCAKPPVHVSKYNQVTTSTLENSEHTFSSLAWRNLHVGCVLGCDSLIHIFSTTGLLGFILAEKQGLQDASDRIEL